MNHEYPRTSLTGGGQNFCGVGVIDGSDWDGLRKMNVNEMYKLAAASDSKPTAQQEEKS